MALGAAHIRSFPCIFFFLFPFLSPEGHNLLNFWKTAICAFPLFPPPHQPFSQVTEGLILALGWMSPAVSFAPGRVPPRQEVGKQLLDCAQGEALFAGDAIFGDGSSPAPTAIRSQDNDPGWSWSSGSVGKPGRGWLGVAGL